MLPERNELEWTSTPTTEVPALPTWKNNALYRFLRRSKFLRRVKILANSHIQGVKLRREVERGFRLVPEKELEDCYRAAFQRLREEDPHEPRGDYLEFGVCHGASMACMHRVIRELRLSGIRLIGFDSFEGLPPEADQPGQGTWRPGEYRSSVSFTRNFLTKAGIDWTRTALVKGWFRDTLTAETRARYGITRASVIMIDCDIYSSAREALEFCESLIRDRAVILFDDWHSGNLAARGMGEKRAFDEFLADHPDLTVTPLPSYAKNAEVFLVQQAHLREAA
ncbi:MAG: class I SAM-dependent methyltransferase [Alphaproteobacteria bacterium]